MVLRCVSARQGHGGKRGRQQRAWSLLASPAAKREHCTASSLRTAPEPRLNRQPAWHRIGPAGLAARATLLRSPASQLESNASSGRAARSAVGRRRAASDIPAGGNVGRAGRSSASPLLPREERGSPGRRPDVCPAPDIPKCNRAPALEGAPHRQKAPPARRGEGGGCPLRRGALTCRGSPSRCCSAGRRCSSSAGKASLIFGEHSLPKRARAPCTPERARDGARGSATAWRCALWPRASACSPLARLSVGLPFASGCASACRCAQ